MSNINIILIGYMSDFAIFLKNFRIFVIVLLYSITCDVQKY